VKVLRVRMEGRGAGGRRKVERIVASVGAIAGGLRGTLLDTLQEKSF